MTIKLVFGRKCDVGGTLLVLFVFFLWNFVSLKTEELEIIKRLSLELG